MEIKESRLSDFYKVLEETRRVRDARGEPGCVRFDFIKVQGSNNKFVLVETYVNQDAVAFHKSYPHYDMWAQFKLSGGMLN